MKLTDNEKFVQIDELKKSLHLFEITYSEFTSGDEEHPDTFVGKIYSPTEELVKTYIEKFCSIGWQKYTFKWKDNMYVSDEVNEKSISAIFSEIKAWKINVDTVIYPKNDF